jgi:hypothetical protein
MWTAIAGLANVVAIAFGPGFYPEWYFLLVAVGYGLLLPAIANLHVRHLRVRDAGSILASAAGTATVTVGIAASANVDLAVAALFVRGIWWWTIGKMWAETGALPRLFGWLTMALAVLCFALVAVYAVTGIPMSPPDLPLRLILGVWLLVIAGLFWRDAR